MNLRPAVIIGNSYRKQLFEPFLITKTFGNRPHIFLPSEKLVNAPVWLAVVIRLLMRFAEVVAVTDKEASHIIEKYIPNTGKEIFWFAWNAANETASWPKDLFLRYSNLKLAFLFSDAVADAHRDYRVPTVHFKFPVYSGVSKSPTPLFLISFFGEVNLSKNLSEKNKALDDYLWARAEQQLESFDAFPSENEMSSVLGTIPYDQAVWILRNRLRFNYVSKLKEKLGAQFALYGNDWAEHGLSAFPAEFDPHKRFEIYAKSKLCLDLLSKSSFEVHYPRTAELVSHSDGIIQPRTAESDSFLSDQASVRTFRNFNELLLVIEKLGSLNQNELSKIGHELRARLESSTREYNLKNLRQ